MDTKEKEKKAAAAVAVTAAAGVFLNGMFSSPADLSRRDDAAPPPPPAAVEYVIPDNDPGGDDDGGLVGSEEDKEVRRSLRSRIRARLLSAPQAVRALVGVPLWCVGWGISSLLSLIWSGLLSPAAAFVLKFLVAAALLLLAVVLTVKAVFPDLPLKKIFNKRSVLTVLIGMAVLAAADLVLGLLCPEKDALSVAVKAAGSLLLMAAAVIPAVVAENTRRRAKMPMPEAPELLPLAGSVK